MSNNMLLAVLAGALALHQITATDQPQTVDTGTAAPEASLDAHDTALYTELDLEMVTRTVYGEARGQGDNEVRAIVHVIVNRWLSGHWGDSLTEVVTRCNKRACQFSVWNKWDANYRVVNNKAIDRSKRFRDIQTIVSQVIEGRLSYTLLDVTGGADHYWHGTKRPWWSKGHTVRRIEAVNIINVRG
jgi:hypothetical protein